METISISPDQVLTTNDFPVHNEQVLKIYFRICQKGHPEMLPPCPVVHKSVGMPLLEGDSKDIKEYNAAIKKYFEENPQAEYILLDGSHKTTALALTGNPLNVMIIRTDEDIAKIRRLIDQGEVFSFATEKQTIKDIVKEHAEHLFEAEFFQTVAHKTDRMVQGAVIPDFMIDFYKKR